MSIDDKFWEHSVEMELTFPAIKKILAAVDLSEYPRATWVLLLVGVVTLVAAVGSYGSRRTRVANLPPGPHNWPIIGAMLEMEPLFHKAVAKFAIKYGPIVFFRLGAQNMVVVSSAEAAEGLFKHSDAQFSDRSVPMSRSAIKYLSFDGTVFPYANYDARYKLHRKLAITEFFTMAKIKSYEQLRTQEVAVMVEMVFSVIQNSGESNGYQKNYSNGPAPMGIRSIATDQVRNVMFSLCIGERFDSLSPTGYLSEFPEIVEEYMDVFMSVSLVDLFPWLTWLDPQGLLKRMKAVDKRNRILYKTMLEKNRQAMRHRKESGISNSADEGSSTNFLHVLLRAQENGTRISDDGIIGTIMTMLIASTETTSAQVEWVLLELVRHPNVFQRLKDELDDVVGRERPLEEVDLQAMPFLNAVILETFRLHGAIPTSFPHANMEPTTLCGYAIPAHTAVILNMSSISLDPKAWKEPLEFNPDRFVAIGSSIDPNLLSKTVLAGGNNYHLLPFSSGRRFCPGYNLGILLVLRTVGSLVHAFDWSLPPGCAPKDMSMEEVKDFIPHPSPDLCLVPTPRVSGHVYKSSIT